MIYYIYDASGNVIGLKYNDDIYYYEKNIQNDITGIMDDSFNMLATYEYDSWGNILSIKDTNGNTIIDSTNIALINPFRYRSYYYDSEIGMYYLNSRYYNSEWGRFINADGIIGANQDMIGYNLYTYVSNNPVNNSDLSGAFNIKSVLKNTAKAISSGISKAGKAVAKVISSVFGAEYNNITSQTTELNKYGIPGIEGSTGITSSAIVKSGDSTKPISVYANNVNSSFLDSSIGLRINIFNFNATLNLGMSDTSLKIGSYDKNTLNSLGLGASLTKFSLFGIIENDNSVYNYDLTSYSRLDINLAIPVAIYGIATGTCPDYSSCLAR